MWASVCQASGHSETSATETEAVQPARGRMPDVSLLASPMDLTAMVASTYALRYLCVSLTPGLSDPGVK